jgi:3,4-dihydroxy 2-butanone 4-phosphate synthase / GTP cyclohydrolase II
MNSETVDHTLSTPSRLAEFDRPTPLGSFHVVCYEYGKEEFAFAVIKGSLPSESLVVRVQSPCLFGESFFVNSCDCGTQLSKALTFGAEQPAFLLLYQTDHEGRGIGMRDKIRAIAEEVNRGVDMVEAFERLHLPLDVRDYRVAAHIIRDLNGDRPIRLLTNNPKKISGLESQGIKISERLPLVVDPPNVECQRYLQTKRLKMGHLLPDLLLGAQS